MVWCFQRRGERVRCEIRRETEGEAFEFALVQQDGSEQVERFPDSAELVEYSVRQFEALIGEGWTVVPPHGLAG